MKLTNEQATKIATMILYSAKYGNGSWIETSPIATPREGRDEIANDIANALYDVSNGAIGREDASKNIVWSGGCNSMEFRMSEQDVKKLSQKFGNAPIYADRKGRQYTFSNGIWSQDYKPHLIDVRLFIDYKHVGYCHNIRKHIENICYAIGDVEIVTEHHVPAHIEAIENNEINDLRR